MTAKKTTAASSPEDKQQPDANTQTAPTMGDSLAQAGASTTPAQGDAERDPNAPESFEEDGEIEAIRVRSIPERRCRAGVCFDQAGRIFTEDELSREQLVAWVADPLLKVESCTVPVQSEVNA